MVAKTCFHWLMVEKTFEGVDWLMVEKRFEGMD